MKRFAWFVACALLLPRPAAGQALPPAPPDLPRAVPSPVPVPAVPPLPAPGPLRVVPVLPQATPFEFDAERQERVRDAQERARDMDERMREMQERIRDAQEMARSGAEDAMARIRSPFTFTLQSPVIRIDGDNGTYSSGLNAVQQRQYDRAVTMFDRVIAQHGPRADGALYWKAFAELRLVRTEDALATLAALRRDFPQSRYLGDAKVLEADLRKMAGQKIDPQQVDANDEIKLLAISGIANTDPDRAIPLLEGVLTATNTLTNKKRAIYVLALSDDPRAHQILLRYAKGAGNPDLQSEAIRYLAARRDSPSRNAELRDIYESTQDLTIRRSIIDAYRNAGDKEALFAIARGRGEAPELRRSAIGGLQNLAAPPELWALYQQETDPALRSQMVNVFASMGAIDQLTSIVKTEKDPAVRLAAVRRLGSQNREQTGQLLADLYGGNQDRDTRRAVIAALASQNNADGLVTIARKESDLELKRDIVKRLSDMAPKNKVAADFLLEVIK